MIFEGCQGKPRTPTLEEKRCPRCGSLIEIFSVDTEAVCEKCGQVIYNDTLSCVQCEYCVRACPKSCLTMNTDLPSISTGRELGRKALHHVEEEVPAEAVPAE